MQVVLTGIELSFVEASAVKLPREVMHALLEDIHLDITHSRDDMTAHFAMQNMQIDNQLLTSSHPVVLARSHEGKFTQMPPAGCVQFSNSTPMVQVLSMKGCNHSVLAFADAGRSGDGGKDEAQPFLEVRVEVQQHNSSIMYFRGLQLSVREAELLVEEDFLDLMIALIRDLPLQVPP